MLCVTVNVNRDQITVDTRNEFFKEIEEPPTIISVTL
jgi:hypothetical protein